MEIDEKETLSTSESGKGVECNCNIHTLRNSICEMIGTYEMRLSLNEIKEMFADIIDTISNVPLLKFSSNAAISES